MWMRRREWFEPAAGRGNTRRNLHTDDYAFGNSNRVLEEFANESHLAEPHCAVSGMDFKDQSQQREQESTAATASFSQTPQLQFIQARSRGGRSI
jgi:hypothetical protein